MVVFGHVDHAKQALGRLQNFPIWGRPLRLAFSRDEGQTVRSDAAQSKRQSKRPDTERPVTAPQQRPAPSHLPSTAGDGSEATGARRRIWDAPSDPSKTMRVAVGVADDEDEESQPTVLSYLFSGSVDNIFIELLV